MIVITVARKPLSELNVATNVLKHGTGAVNVDGCRVSASPGDEPSSHSQSHEAAFDDRKVYGKYAGGLVTQQSAGQKLGRWPANLILQHLDGCHEVGIRSVATGVAVMRNRDGLVHNQVLGARRSVASDDVSYGNNGVETITAWACLPGCPVADLDMQSGTRPVSGSAQGARKAESCNGSGPTFTEGLQTKGVGALHNDTGGASRYFKQVGGKRR